MLLFQARNDINFIIHTHTKATEVLSTLNCKVLPISHPGLMMHARTGYVDYAYHHDESFCNRMIEAMHDNVCLLMGNHGMVAVGKTAAEVFFNTFTFDQACLIQLEAYQSGQEIKLPDNVEEISDFYTLDAKRGDAWDGSQEWAGWLRMLDRNYPDYKM